MRLVLIVFLLAPVSIIAQVKHDSPVLVWKEKINQPILSNPVIDRDLVFFGASDSTFYCRDLNKGSVKWKFRTGGRIRSGAYVAGANILFNGGDGVLYCLEKTTGKSVWTFRTLGGILGERRYDAADYFDSAPVVANGVVYFGSGDGKLYAINVATGKMIWNFTAGDIIHTTPVLNQDKIFFGSSDGYLYALDIASGNLQWKFKSVGHRNFPRGEMQGSPVVSGDLVFIGSRDYNLYAIDANGGFGHWNRQFPQGWATALQANDSVLYVGTSDDRLFLAVNPKTGRELWKFEAKFNIFGPATIAGNQVMFGTQIGKLFSLDRKTGKMTWVFQTDGYTNNRLRFFNDDDSFRDDLFTRIKTFDDYVGMLYTLGAIYTTPAISGNMIVVTTSEGMVYALRRN